MRNFNIILFIGSFILFTSYGYSQQRSYVDKDSRIKKYQSDMINFLVEKKLLDNKNVLNAKSYFNSMFVYKTIEIFPWSDRSKHSGVLLVKFGLLGDDIPHYWGILEENSKFLFGNVSSPAKDLLDYIEKYNKGTQDIILYTLKLYKPYEP